MKPSPIHILSIRKGESICIGSNINIQITDVEKNYVSLGIDAPKSIHILRAELIKDKQKQSIGQ